MCYIGEKKEKGCKRSRGVKAINGEVCSIYRKGLGIMIFEVRGRGEKPSHFMEKVIGNKILLDMEVLFVRE
ncbi:MAG: hypothetical protein ACM3SR_12955 [Ignavibacteriales bacterium]